MSFDPNRVPSNRGHNCFVDPLTGNKFPYEQGNPESERTAYANQQLATRARIQNREQTVGHRMTMREMLNGVTHDDPRTLREKIADGGGGGLLAIENPDVSPVNPHAIRLAELQRKTAFTPGDKAKLQRRIEQCEREGQAWEEIHAPQPQAPNVNAINSALNHARMVSSGLRDNPVATVQDLELAAERETIAQTNPELYGEAFATWAADFARRQEETAKHAEGPIADLEAQAERARQLGRLPEAPTTEVTK